MKKENILIYRWKDDGRIKVTKDVDLPTEPVPVLLNFAEDLVIGEAKNFHRTEEGIICDMELDEKTEKMPINIHTLAPSFIIENGKAKCVNKTGVVIDHGDKELTKNLKE